MTKTSEEMLLKAGFTNVEVIEQVLLQSTVHEMGTARMGNDPKLLF
jgi:choline dehydrogenase-like flavoprotein